MHTELSGENIEALCVFSKRIAKAFDKNRSSHVMFFMQQAFDDLYEDGLSWNDTEQLLSNIITICELRDFLKA
ncbi:hypothetical protein LCGC14_2125140 [marine sediment metagenome]|uniref:Uncharacterized protein n=1 Tax=marine sediment metagenome TaxID=412755 RepID=A0A0F9GG71_9ZZZZ